MPLAVLITRPEPQASRFAAALETQFPGQVAVTLSPLMAVEWLDPALPPGPFAALILTSETGAMAAGRLRRPSPSLAFCVGDRTAEAARELGFDAISAQGDATDLVALITRHAQEGELLYLHGQDRAADLAAALPDHSVTSLAVYRQAEKPLTTAACGLLSGEDPVILPLFSPRSARLLAAALPVPHAPLHPVAISANTRDALPAALAARCGLADRPEAAALLQAIGRLIFGMVP